MLLKFLVIVGLVLALFPPVRRRLVTALGRAFAALFVFALVFLAVVVLTQP